MPPGDGAEENFLREGQFFSDDVKAGRVKKILAEQELSESAIEVDSERADCRSWNMIQAENRIQDAATAHAYRQ